MVAIRSLHEGGSSGVALMLDGSTLDVAEGGVVDGVDGTVDSTVGCTMVAVGAGAVVRLLR